MDIKVYPKNVSGIRQGLSQKMTGSPEDITNALSNVMRRVIQGIAEEQASISQTAVQAVTYALAEVMREAAANEMPVYTGSLQQAVVIDTSKPIFPSGNKRRYVGTVSIGIGDSDVRYERSSAESYLYALGIGIDSKEPVQNYNYFAKKGGRTLKEATAMGRNQSMSAADYLRVAIGPHPVREFGMAFLELKQSKGFLVALLDRLDQMRAELASENYRKIEDKAYERIQELKDKKDYWPRYHAAKKSGRWPTAGR